MSKTVSSKTVSSFNNTLLKLCKLVKNEYPNSIVGSNYFAIESTLSNSNSDNYLMLFAGKILVNKTYIEQIKKGNDNFFMQNTSLFSGDSGLSIDNILNFKQMWIDLKDAEKNKIKQYLKILLKLSSKYMDEN